ncbi:MAG TPA: winged helix-turn-helix transcriptional regulator [Verrucomicrobiae bacterium]|nr:winged helix-turn-helix transcriptional regulator [Verrucomicrobiae bacterium]
MNHIAKVNHAGRVLDDQEKLIVRALIRDPRLSDNQIGKLSGVPTPSVRRKRKKLEAEGLLSYFAALDMQESGTGAFGARHLYVIKFRIGITVKQLVEEIRHEPNVRTIFTDLIYESHIAEIDGRVALVMIIEGKHDADIVENVQGNIVPSLRKNHGPDSIEEISTIRLLNPVRIFHNYVPLVNMRQGVLNPDWPNDAVFVG